MGREQIQEVLDAQNPHWEKTYTKNPEMFGDEPSEPARMAVEICTEAGAMNLLELGGGQGRDTIYFAQNGLTITTLDYAEEGVKAIAGKAEKFGFSQAIKALRHDVRNPLPFPDASFDVCYSHMLFCMAFTTAELEFLSSEIRRVLRPGGLNVYTVRHTGDPHYGTGIHRDEDMYEVNGFIVHFFSREKVEHLARGYEIVSIDEFEEGPLPRKLFRVTLKRAEA